MKTIFKMLRKLTGYRSRMNYWSCSPFSDYLRRLYRLNEKPTSATSKGWKEWNDNNKRFSKIGYYITEELLDQIQNFLLFPKDVYVNFKYKFKMYFIDRHDLIDTKLERGGFYDIDTRMKHGLFSLIVDFVEKEDANMTKVFSDDNNIGLSNRELGLKHLDWEINLKDSPGQSSSAKEIKEIYLWIKDIRPNRKESMDVSGWSKYCDEKDDIFETDEKDKNKVSLMLKEMERLDENYFNEDTDMMMRIIKVRRHL